MPRTPKPADDRYRQMVAAVIKAKGTNISAVARASNVGRLDLARWVIGERGISAEKLARVFDVLHIRVTTYSGKDKPCRARA